jgi:hypothetical protein
LSSCGLTTAVHNKDPEWSKSSLLVRACACSRRGPQPWVVAAASSRGHLLICCMQPAGSVLRRSLAVCGSSFPPWRSSLCHPPLCGHADQHGGGNMIQVCLLLLGFCLWGSDRHIGSSIRPWWVNVKHAKKVTNPPGPHCSSLSCNGWGLRFEEKGGGASRPSRWEIRLLIDTITALQLQAERGDSYAWLGKGNHGKVGKEDHASQCALGFASFAQLNDSWALGLG